MSKLNRCKDMIRATLCLHKESFDLIDQVDRISNIGQIYELLQQTENVPLGYTYQRIDKIMGDVTNGTD